MLGRVRQQYKKTSEEYPTLAVFLLVALAFEAIVLLVGILTLGASIEDILFEIHNCTFSDFMDCINTSIDVKTDIYPPFIQIIFAWLWVWVEPAKAAGIWEYIKYLFYPLLFSIVYLSIYKCCKGFGGITGSRYTVLLAAVLLSLPSLYCFERGNIIIVALFFMFVFLKLYSSEDAKLRNIAYISLGIATGIKIYPALLAAILIRERKWKEFGKCTLIVSMMFLIPFLFANGTIIDYLHILTNTGSSPNYSVHFDHIDIANTLKCYYCMLDMEINETLIRTVCYGLAAALFIGTVANRNAPAWKIVAALTLICVGCTGFRPVYAILLISPALFLFLGSKEKLTVSNTLYLVCFLLMFLPMIQVFLEVDGVEAIYGNTIGKIGITTILEGFGVLSLSVLLAIDLLMNSMIDMIRSRKQLR